MICAGAMDDSALAAAKYPPSADIRVPPRSRPCSRTAWTPLVRPWRRTAPARRSEPDHRSARRVARCMAWTVSGFNGPTNCSSSCAMGAISHAHRHSTSVKRQLPVGGRSVRANSQAGPELGCRRLRSPQQARQARADPQLAPASFRGAKHRVERHHLANVGDGHAQAAVPPRIRPPTGSSRRSPAPATRAGSIAARGSS